MNRTRILVLLPVFVFLGIAGAFLWGLYFGNAREVPSALIGRPAPQFDLAPLAEGAERFATADLMQGEASIVNVWASWCVPCRAEHELLMEIRERGLAPLYGLNYKNDPEDARAFLDELGDPFDKVGVDRNGRTGIDWGVYGVPETFVVDGAGRIVYKHIGPLVPGDIEGKIVPALEKARAGAPQG